MTEPRDEGCPHTKLVCDDCGDVMSVAEAAAGPRDEGLREAIEAASFHEEMANGTGDPRAIMLDDLWSLLTKASE